MRALTLRSFLAVALLLPVLALAGERGKVSRVVDGDTIKVKIGRTTETVRLIGVDTPETVHRNRPVEYFGKEPSAFTKRMAYGKRVQLEDDPECTNRDKYGRYGFAYTKYPFSRMEESRKLERKARREGRGLWAE